MNYLSKFLKKIKNRKDERKNKIIKLSRKEVQNNGSTTFNDEVERFHIAKLLESKESGIKLSRRTPPLPNLDSTTSPSFEDKLNKDYQSKADKLFSWADPQITELDNNYTEQIHQYVDYKNNKEMQDQEIKNQVNEKKEIDLANLSATSEKQQQDVDERIAEGVLKLEHSKGNKDEIEDELELIGEPAPSKKPFYYYLILALLSFLEFPLNEITFRAMRESYVHTFIMSLGISITIPILGHLAGRYAKARKESVKDYIFLFLPIVTAITLSFIVGYVRSDYLLERHINVLSVPSLAFLNLAFFVVGLLLSYHYSFKNPELVKHYFKTIKEYGANQQELKLAKAEKENLDHQLAEQKKSLIDKYEAEIKDKTVHFFSNLRKAILKTANEYNHLLSSVISLEELIDSYFFQAIHEFRHANTQRRADCKTPICFATEPEHLNLKFKDHHKKEPFVDSKNDNLEVSDTHNNMVPVKLNSNNAGNILKQMATVLFIAFCSSIFLVGCQSSEYNSTLVYVAVDKTGSYEINNPLSSSDILEISNMNSQENNGCTVFTTDINDVSLNKVQKVSIEKGHWADNNLDRQDLLDTFSTELDSLLYPVFAFEGEKKKSSIYLPLSDLLNSIVADSSDTKVLFLYSDMFENNRSQTISFYQFAKNPSLLLSSFDKVVKSLEKVEALPDLNGIEINIIYTPSVANDDLFVYARKFWERLLSQKGAKVEFLANY